MPHRIKWISNTNYQNLFVSYNSNDFSIQFQDAASILKLWRNPNLGRSSREGTIVGLASKARVAESYIKQTLLTNDNTYEREKELVEQLKLYSFLLQITLPKALELVNQDKLLSEDEINRFIKMQQQLMYEEFNEKFLESKAIMEQLHEITDIEIQNADGQKMKIKHNNVIETIGRALGFLLEKQVTLRPIDDIDSRPIGRLLLKKTYHSAILRSKKIPPVEIMKEDIKVLKKDRTSLIYFIVDVSQSMNKVIYSNKLTRLDGALLTSLGLFYYFNHINRQKRREYDTFKMHLVPVTQVPYVIENKEKLEDFLLKAEAKGKTRLVHSLHAAVNHVLAQNKKNDYDVQIVILSDGVPNVPFSGKLPGQKSKELELYFQKRATLKIETANCMMQLNQYFNHLKHSKTRSWNVKYFLMAKEKTKTTKFFTDTNNMLKGVTKPIIIDPTEIDTLSKKIIQETVR